MCTINLRRRSSGREGSAQTQFGRVESTFYFFAGYTLDFVADFWIFRHEEDIFSTQKALQTVVAGQQAENLLYVLLSLLYSF